jgi:hypothetical protein
MLHQACSTKNLLICAAIGLSLGLAACQSGSPASIETNASPVEPAAEHFLAWWSVEEGGYATALVRSSRDGEAEVIAEGAGLYIATSDAIWAWDERVVTTSQVDCECMMEANATGAEMDCSVPRDIVAADLVQVDGDQTIEAFPVQAKYEGEVEPSPRVTGSSGPYITTVDCSYGYWCGAHGNVECAFKAWNLDTAAPMEPDAFVDTLSRPNQIALLNGEPRDETISEDDLVGLVSVKPTWSADGVCQLDALYSAGACYACSDGEWSSYTVSATHEDATPKVELEPAPQAVVDVWSGTSGGRGWSRLTADEVDRVANLLRGE